MTYHKNWIIIAFVEDLLPKGICLNWSLPFQVSICNQRMQQNSYVGNNFKTETKYYFIKHKLLISVVWEIYVNTYDKFADMLPS